MRAGPATRARVDRAHSNRPGALFALLPTVVGALVGLVAAIPSHWAVPVVVVAGLVLLAVALGWRSTLRGMMRYLPFAGVLTVLLYPNVGLAALGKDLLFVLPLYISFTPALRNISLRGFPLAVGVPLLGYAAVATGQAAVTIVQGQPLVALIGLRVTLLYLPLILVGWVVGASRHDTHQLARLAARWAAVSAIILIGQALLLYGGQETVALAPYGAAAEAVTQDFASFDIGAMQLRRVPGTYPFVTQAFVHLLLATVLSLALWRSPVGRWPDYIIAMLCGVATVVTGARLAWLSVPFVLVSGWMLSRRNNGGRQIQTLVTVMAGATVTFFSASYILDLSRHIRDLFHQEFVDLVIHGFARVNELGLLGHGLGVGANAGRYVAGKAFLSATGGVWLEGWYVRVLLELGLPGLIAIATLLFALAAQLARACWEGRGRQDPLVTAGAITVLWTIGASLKGQFLDFDPLSVLFWLIMGIALRRMRSGVAESEGTRGITA